MYVRVRTPQGLNQNAILVPQRAVQRSADGQASVMLLGEGDTVEVRQVTTGAMQGSRWQISEGLQAGDKVMTTGSPARSVRAPRSSHASKAPPKKLHSPRPSKPENHSCPCFSSDAPILPG